MCIRDRCGLATSCHKCEGCESVEYCSLECEREAWNKGHDKVCTKLQNVHLKQRRGSEDTRLRSMSEQTRINAALGGSHTRPKDRRLSGSSECSDISSGSEAELSVSQKALRDLRLRRRRRTSTDAAEYAPGPVENLAGAGKGKEVVQQLAAARQMAGSRPIMQRRAALERIGIVLEQIKFVEDPKHAVLAYWRCVGGWKANSKEKATSQRSPVRPRAESAALPKSFGAPPGWQDRRASAPSQAAADEAALKRPPHLRILNDELRVKRRSSAPSLGATESAASSTTNSPLTPMEQRRYRRLGELEGVVTSLNQRFEQKCLQMQQLHEALHTRRAEAAGGSKVMLESALKDTSEIREQLAVGVTETSELREQIALATGKLEEIRAELSPKLCIPESPAPSIATDCNSPVRGPAAISFEEVAASTDNFSQSKWIGFGGQSGGVFRGTWNGLSVAVKRMEKHHGADGFHRELTALSAVRHQNVLRVFAYNEDGCPDGHRYLMMPLMSGGDFASALPRLRADARVRVLRGALDGLDALHGANILHFDIKPENILIDGRGNGRLADCGLARPMDRSLNSNCTMAQPTVPSAAQGTPGYVDPEFTRSGEYHRYCDVYSMGLVMLQVVTGKASVLWLEGDNTKVHLIDYCDEASEDVGSIEDPLANWTPPVASQLLELGFRCTELSSRKSKVIDVRPSVKECSEEVTKMMKLAPLPAPIASQKECVVCLENPRGYHRLMPCRHSVTCGECTAMLQLRGADCIVCENPIEFVQEGWFPDTFDGTTSPTNR
eukprot:TRINITY_DN14176_c0_g5_i1.p1 TRINITY_DN14176_c0_g5~~TRINITY_DN14176_c0_g5_i1.p1  ORF type:complete len:782 (+),score=165.07 TRINITY_DN14176_c0_g5_i1:52-2397(+)